MIKKAKPIYLILFFAFILRLIGINQSLWLDESISATVVKNYSISYVWNNFIFSDTHPPFYYILLKVWTTIFGFSEIALRTPSLIAGVATVFSVYLITRKVFSEKVGLLAAILLATSGLHVYYSQEARMYGLTTFLVTLVIYLFLIKKWVYLALALTILAMTDYLPMTIVLVLFSSIILFKGYQNNLYPFLISLLPSVFFYIYWAKVFLYQSRSTLSYLSDNKWWGSVLGESSLKDLSLVWIKFILGRVSFDSKLFYALTVVFVSLFFGYALMSSLKSIRKSTFLWVWLIIPILSSFLMSLGFPGFSYFRLIFTLPAFYILISIGIYNTKWKKLVLGLILSINLIFALLYLLNTTYHREDWKGLVSFVENKIGSHEVVLVSFSKPFTPYLWYSQKKDKIVPFSPDAVGTKTEVYTLDYLMDLTDPERRNYQSLVNLGFKEITIYNFRGTGQVRYWKR